MGRTGFTGGTPHHLDGQGGVVAGTAVVDRLVEWVCGLMRGRGRCGCFPRGPKPRPHAGEGTSRSTARRCSPRRTLSPAIGCRSRARWVESGSSKWSRRSASESGLRWPRPAISTIRLRHRPRRSWPRSPGAIAVPADRPSASGAKPTVFSAATVAGTDWPRSRLELHGRAG